MVRAVYDCGECGGGIPSAIGRLWLMLGRPLPLQRDVAILDEPEHLTWFEGAAVCRTCPHVLCTQFCSTQRRSLSATHAVSANRTHKIKPFIVDAFMMVVGPLGTGRQRWTDHFKHVVGIMHTNYEAYVREEAGALAASVIARSTTLLTRSHCHKVCISSHAAVITRCVQ